MSEQSATADPKPPTNKPAGYHDGGLAADDLGKTGNPGKTGDDGDSVADGYHDGGLAADDLGKHSKHHKSRKDGGYHDGGLAAE
jgi:hypothetical protein